MFAAILVRISIIVLFSLQLSNSSFDYMDTNWASADNFCGPQFNTQSPIDIVAEDLSICPNSSPLDWYLTDGIQTFQAFNNGHTLVFSPDNSGSHQSTLKNNFVTPSSEHRTYCLQQFHMHWGKQNDKGSEHTLNGESTVLEFHFVHYSCDYDNIQQAIESMPDDQYVLAVVGVLYTLGEPNPFIDGIIDHMQSVKYHLNQTKIQGNMNDLIPDIGTFYYYKGSLTTPPCNAIVAWTILEQTKTLSEEQLNKLRQGMFDDKDKLLELNYRPIQENVNDVFLCPNQIGLDETNDLHVDNEDEHMANFIKTSLVAIWIFIGVFIMLNIAFLCYYVKRNKKPTKETNSSDDLCECDLHQ